MTNSFKRKGSHTIKNDMMVLDPSRLCSIIVDGADRSAFGLPHFVSSIDNDKGYSSKVRLIRFLDQGMPNRQYLYTVEEEYENGASHVVDAIQRFINQIVKSCFLPDTLFIQFDNCTREDKNR